MCTTSHWIARRVYLARTMNILNVSSVYDGLSKIELFINASFVTDGLTFEMI